MKKIKKLIDKINNWAKEKECALKIVYFGEINGLIAILFLKSENYIGMAIFGIISVIFILLSIPLFICK